MAKITMTIAEALKNHAVIETMATPVIYQGYKIELLYLASIERPTILWEHILKRNPDDKCDVELIDAEDLEIKIAELNKRLAQLKAVEAQYVNNND